MVSTPHYNLYEHTHSANSTNSKQFSCLWIFSECVRARRENSEWFCMVPIGSIYFESWLSHETCSRIMQLFPFHAIHTHTHRTQHGLTLWVNETTNIFINYKFSHHQTSSAPNRRWCVCRCVSCAVVCTAQMSQVNQMYEKQYCLWMANEFWDTINFYRVSLYACRWLMLSIAYHRTWLVGLLFFV